MKPRILTAIGILCLICAFWLGLQKSPSHHRASITPGFSVKVSERASSSTTEPQRTERTTTRNSEWFENESTLLGSEDPRSNPRIAPVRNSMDVDRKHPDTPLSKLKFPSSFSLLSIAQPSAYHPAAWVDLDEDMNTPDGFEQAIQQEAERLLEELSQIDAADVAARNAAIVRSDQLFKQRYGGWRWMQHHVHAHHLAELQ
jgi:hypothetical protein